MSEKEKVVHNCENLFILGKLDFDLLIRPNLKDKKNMAKIFFFFFFFSIQ